MSEQADFTLRMPEAFRDSDKMPALTLWEWLAGVVFPILGACIAAVMLAPGLLESKRASFFSVTTFLAAPAIGVLSSAYVFANWPRPARTLYKRSFRAGWLIAAGAFYFSIFAPPLTVLLVLGGSVFNHPTPGIVGFVILTTVPAFSGFVYLRRVQLHPSRKAMPWSGMAAGALVALGVPLGLILLSA